MSIKAIVSAVGRFDKTVSKTVVESAREIASRVWNTFGGEVLEDQMVALLNAIEENASWKGTASASVRRSEWKSFVNAVPYYLPEAISYYQREYGGFTRVIMFRLARALPTCENYKMACSKVHDAIVNGKAGNGSNGQTPAQAFASAIARIKNVKTSTRKLIEFRKELAQLCQKYGI